MCCAGFIEAGGSSRQSYGGHTVIDSLNRSLTEYKYRFFTDVEFTLVRAAAEQVRDTIERKEWM